VSPGRPSPLLQQGRKPSRHAVCRMDDSDVFANLDTARRMAPSLQFLAQSRTAARLDISGTFGQAAAMRRDSILIRSWGCPHAFELYRTDFARPSANAASHRRGACAGSEWLWRPRAGSQRHVHCNSAIAASENRVRPKRGGSNCAGLGQGRAPPATASWLRFHIHLPSLVCPRAGDAPANGLYFDQHARDFSGQQQQDR